MALLLGIGIRPTTHQAHVVADFLVGRERDGYRRARDEAANIAHEEAVEYAKSAKALDAAGRVDAGTQEVHGELACKRVEERIRAMEPPKP